MEAFALKETFPGGSFYFARDGFQVWLRHDGLDPRTYFVSLFMDVGLQQQCWATRSRPDVFLPTVETFTYGLAIRLVEWFLSATRYAADNEVAQFWINQCDKLRPVRKGEGAYRVKELTDILEEDELR